MSPVALSAVTGSFESFPEFLASREGKLGVNMACYVGHSAVRRTVMGEAGLRARSHRRRDRADARDRRRGHGGRGGRVLAPRTGPTQLDGDDRPVPSRFASMDELEVLVRARRATTTAGRSATSTAAPSEGSTLRTKTCCSTSARSRAGCRSSCRASAGAPRSTSPGRTGSRSPHVDRRHRAPGRRDLSRCCGTIPSTVTSGLERGTNLYEGVPLVARSPAGTVCPGEAGAARRRPGAACDEMRHAVEHPNNDGAKGSTLPPPAGRSSRSTRWRSRSTRSS